MGEEERIKKKQTKEKKKCIGGKDRAAVHFSSDRPQKKERVMAKREKEVV